MKRLSREIIIQRHSELIEKFGGLYGIRDNGLLDSAINQPYQTFANTELYPTIIDKASKLCFGIAKNHPFIDGNKRTAAFALEALLNINSYNLISDDQELIEIIYKLSSSEISEEEFNDWVHQRSVFEI